MPQSIDFVRQLINMELQVQMKVHDSHTLNRIIHSYGVLVEYYDAVKDPIKFYFLEKIQQTLSLPESLHHIMPDMELKQRFRSIDSDLLRLSISQTSLIQEQIHRNQFKKERTILLLKNEQYIHDLNQLQEMYKEQTLELGIKMYKRVPRRIQGYHRSVIPPDQSHIDRYRFLKDSIIVINNICSRYTMVTH